MCTLVNIHIKDSKRGGRGGRKKKNCDAWIGGQNQKREKTSEREWNKSETKGAALSARGEAVIP